MTIAVKYLQNTIGWIENKNLFVLESFIDLQLNPPPLEKNPSPNLKKTYFYNKTLKANLNCVSFMCSTDNI